MNNENKLVPDFRQETIQTYTETYTPEGGTEQTATYKIGTAHPIISGILDKLAWVRTHVAAVWWNKLAGVTLKDKITSMDENIAQLNGNMIIFRRSILPGEDLNDILIPGLYSIYSAAAPQIKNLPINSACVIEILASEQYIVQKVHSLSASKTRFRSSAGWFDWY